LLTYENPRWTGSEKWKLTLSGLYDTSRNVRTYTGSRLEGAFQLEHRLNKTSTGLYRYTYRRTTIDSGSLQIQPELIPLTSQPVRAALISGTYIQDRRDDPTDATRGIFNTVDLSFASGYWGSQPDFFRFFGQNSTYHRLSRRLVLARTFQLGLLAPWGELPSAEDPMVEAGPFASPDPRIPLSERFFAGGANSHRGFPFNQAGPRDPVTGFPLGGGAELLNSVELRFPLIGENIGGVLFHDAGNVFSTPSDIAFRFGQRSVELEDGQKTFDYDYLVQAVGFGLRYRTPIGPVRIDLGYSINPPRFIGFSGTREQLLAGQGEVREQAISHFQFHFSLGQTF
jgi:outer membrane protein assembly factor BamA